jgi:ADP-ribose pyrophosphatase YjhB (NUDIX family)
MGISPYVAGLRGAVGSRLLMLPSVSVLPRDSAGRVLLVRHADSGTWGTIGGFVEPDESPREAAVREAREEASVGVELVRLLAALGGPEFRVCYPNGDEAGYVPAVFEAQIVSGEPAPDGVETTEVAWVPLPELNEVDLSAIARAQLSDLGWIDSSAQYRGFAQDCAECGFVYDENEAGGAAGAILDGAHAMARLLEEPADDARTRPEPRTWSALEYGCHLRDVLLVQRERVLLARRSVEPPRPAPMGRDERAEHDGYASQSPEDVARQLQDAAQLLANVLDYLDERSWTRTLVYSFPTPQERSLRWVAVHTVHEVRHHLQDVRRGLNS